jgi:hypothetical protein
MVAFRSSVVPAWARSARAGATALGTAALLTMAASPLAVGIAVNRAQSQTQPQTQPAISVARAAASAETILNVLKSGDANARYALFSSELKAASSPALVARSMQRQPRLLSWSITAISTGLSTATVQANLRTSQGSADVLLVINDQGQLVAYHLDEANVPTTKVAAEFIEALTNGQYITARSFLSLDLQSEISPQSLQRKWLGLQRLTGDYVRTRRIVEAERGGGMRLVLVNLEFGRLTDNLFVVLDQENRIVGLDFPTEPAQPQPVR